MRFRLTRYFNGAAAPGFVLRDNATIYDGLYLALAEALGATLLTRDKPSPAPGVEARVEAIA